MALRAAGSLLLLLAAAGVNAYNTQQLSAAQYARAVTAAFTVSPGTKHPLYKVDSPTLLSGNDGTSRTPPLAKQIVSSDGISPLVLNLTSTGRDFVVLAAGNVFNFFDQNVSSTEPLYPSGDGDELDNQINIVEPYILTVQDFDPDNALFQLTTPANSVSLQWTVRFLEATNVSIPFAFCVDRDFDTLFQHTDVVAITFQPLGGGAETNVALTAPGSFAEVYNGNSVYNMPNIMATNLRFDNQNFLAYAMSHICTANTDLGDKIGPCDDSYTVCCDYDPASAQLKSNIFCQVSDIAVFSAVAGDYTVRMTASKDVQETDGANNFAPYLIVSARVAVDFPDVYNSKLPLLSSVYLLNTTATIDNWCVIATDDNANDFAPGYRVTSTDAPSNENQFCCRASGNYNVTTQKCVVKSCVNSPAFEYSSFIHIQEFAGQHTHSCYALCEPRTSYIDSNPRVSLANQMTALYDAREISYTTETPTTLAEATYYSDGANRRGIYIAEEFVSTTGVRLNVSNTEWLCTRRGEYLGGTQAKFQCVVQDLGFFYVQSDGAAFKDCYTGDYPLVYIQA